METKDICIRKGIETLGIFEKNADAWVSSKDIAQIFGKDHGHVMRDIRERILPEVSERFNQSNFGLVKRKDKKGEMRNEYLLNRNAFTIVVMGFNGKKAMRFKEAYIEAFNAMETVIETRLISKQGYKEMSGAISLYNRTPEAFAKEADMINQIVLGMKASDFRAVNGIKDHNTRDSVAHEYLERLDKAQRLNAQLITAGLNYEEREKIIRSNFKKY